MRGRSVAAAVLGERRGAVAATTALLGAHQVCEAGVPLLVGVILDEAIAPGDERKLALLLTGLVVLFVALSYSYRFGARLCERMEAEAGHELRLRLTSRVLDPCGGAEDGRLAGHLTTVAGTDAARVGGFTGLIADAASALLGALAGATFLLAQSLPLGLIVLGGLPVLMLAVELLSRPLARRSGRQQQEIAAAGAIAADLVAGLRPLKGIGGEAAGEARYRAASRRARAASIDAERANAAYEGAIVLCTGLLLVVVALVGGRLAANGDLSLGGLIAALGLTQFIVGPLGRLGWIGMEGSRVRAAARRVAAVLAAPPAITGGAMSVPDGPGEVELRDVRDHSLEHISLSVNPGELLGIAAHNPAQGARLVALLAREHDPADGEIALDGMPLSLCEPRALRAALLVAAHDARLFDGTLRETVLGAEGDPHSLRQALYAAAADDVVASVPGGLEGAVSERGRSLSGGQRQRVALARALCAGSRVLVLHDPTTAVDPATEARIASRLRDARRGRTTILVTTSPMLLAVTDRVIMLDGRVVDEGDHAALLDDNQDYRAMVLA